MARALSLCDNVSSCIDMHMVLTLVTLSAVRYGR